MSRRNIINQYQVINDADSSATIQSIATDISGVDSVIYRLLADTTVNSNFTVFVSNKPDMSDSYALNFGSPTVIDGSVDQEYMITIENKGFKYMNLELLNNGGTGNVSAWISGTTVGA